MILRILVLVSMANIALGFSMNVNSVVDRMLPVVNCVTRNSGKSVLELEDLHIYMGFRMFFLTKMSLHLDCSKGHVQSLDSLERAGDVKATVEGGKIIVEGKLRLKNLSFGYNNCKCKIFHIHRRTAVNATISSHSIKFKASYIQQGNGNCTTTIESLEIDEFGEVQVISGHLAPHWAERRFLPMFRNYIIKNMKDMLLDEMPELDFCEIMNPGNSQPNSTKICYL